MSPLDQNEKHQLDGQVLNQAFTDKASGRDTARPELTELLRFARDGDTVVVHSMDRLARGPYSVGPAPEIGNIPERSRRLQENLQKVLTCRKTSVEL